MEREPATDRISRNEIADLFKRQREYGSKLALTTSRERKEKLRRMLVYVMRHAEKIEQATYFDLKKPAHEARLSEILTLTSELRYHIKHLDRWMKPHRVPTPLLAMGTQSHIRYEPKGTSLIISPWNYPVNLALKPLISAVSAGCTSIIKPSEFAPNSAAFIRKLVQNLFPPEEVSVVEGDREVATDLLEQPFDHIFFTGSPATAKLVMQAASRHLTSVSFELGGKSPSIIDQTADITATAKKIAWAKFLNSGQSCIAPDYVLVHKDVHDLFLTKINTAIQSMYSPDGESIRRSTDYGRVINEHHFDRLTRLFQQALDHGAKLVTGGNADRQDLFIEPTILTNVNLSTSIMQEEIFGPILPVISYKTLPQAIEIVNSLEKPLAVYIHSRSTANIDYLLTRTNSGNAMINEMLIQFQHSEIPFGGVGSSGMGRANGFFGFKEFSNPKGVIARKFGTLNFLYPPYSEKTRKLLGWMQRYL